MEKGKVQKIFGSDNLRVCRLALLWMCLSRALSHCLGTNHAARFHSYPTLPQAVFVNEQMGFKGRPIFVAFPVNTEMLRLEEHMLHLFLDVPTGAARVIFIAEFVKVAP